ncbi:hypothetical protein EC988_010356, partial [Linderina pennispora]
SLYGAERLALRTPTVPASLRRVRWSSDLALSDFLKAVKNRRPTVNEAGLSKQI